MSAPGRPARDGATQTRQGVRLGAIRVHVSGLVATLAFAALLRLAVIPLTYGHDFAVWDAASRLLLRGINPYTHWRAMPNAYPYLPVYLYILLPFRWVALHSGLSFIILGKLPLVAADLAIGATLYRYLRLAGRSTRAGVFAACLYLFNPLVIYNSAFLGRFDAVALAFLLPAFLVRGWRFAVLYGLAVATKTFPIFIVPALMVGRYRRTPRELAAAAGVMVAVTLPFLLADPGALLYNLVVRSSNIDWAIAQPLGLSWQYVLLHVLSPAIYTALQRPLLVLFALTVLLWRNRPPLTLCALTFSLFLLIDHKVWEQYLTWPLPFLIACGLLHRDLPALLLAAGMTVASAFNNEQRLPVDPRYQIQLIPYPTVTLNVLLALGIVLYLVLTMYTQTDGRGEQGL